MSLDDDLRRWQEAGLLDTAQAGAIRAFESAREQRGGDRPGFAEAAVYLALAVIGVGVVVLLALNWDDLSDGVRVAIPAVAGLGALGAGVLMFREQHGGIQRGGSVAWFVAVGLITAAVAVAGDLSDMGGTSVALLCGGVATGLAVALWILRPGHPQVVAIAGGIILLGAAEAARADSSDWSLPLFGGTVALFGLCGLLLAELDMFWPRSTARALSGFGLAAGGFAAALPNSPAVAQAAVFVAAAVLVVASLRFSVFIYMAFGVTALFLGLVTVILRHTESPTTAAVALIALGVVVLGVVLVLARVKPWRPGTEAPA